MLFLKFGGRTRSPMMQWPTLADGKPRLSPGIVNAKCSVLIISTSLRRGAPASLSLLRRRSVVNGLPSITKFMHDERVQATSTFAILSDDFVSTPDYDNIFSSGRHF